jgi:hypothetical protein
MADARSDPGTDLLLLLRSSRGESSVVLQKFGGNWASGLRSSIYNVYEKPSTNIPGAQTPPKARLP